MTAEEFNIISDEFTIYRQLKKKHKNQTEANEQDSEAKEEEEEIIE